MSESGISVVDYFATWCGPCKVIAPKVIELSNNTFPDVRFYKVDVDELSDVAREQGVRAMPTFLIYKDGKKVGQGVVGANAKELEKEINEVVQGKAT